MNQLESSIVFRDPIHKYIVINESIIIDLINSKEMQRLRHIHQLGGTMQVYHTAEHSRFQHSLGVYEIVREIVNENEFVKEYLSNYDKLCVMIAGLLHDIGHGPFSHAFESVFTTKHELRTIQIINEDTEINQILKKYNPKLIEDVTKIIDKTHVNKILVSLTSSQLDADRMDYLLRDAYFTGTSYGNFDISRILRTIRIHNNEIVFKQSGVNAIEDYIMARYQMYWQVYFHPTSRSYELLLVSIFKRIVDLYKNNYIFNYEPLLLMPFLKNDYTINDFLLLDDATLIYYFKLFQKEKDDILSDLATRFMNRYLFGYTIYNKEKYDELENLLKDKSDYYLFYDTEKQIPYYFKKGSTDQIKIINNEKVYDLSVASEIVNAIVYNSNDRYVERLYCLKELL